jgi:hypothetical protein
MLRRFLQQPLWMQFVVVTAFVVGVSLVSTFLYLSTRPEEYVIYRSDEKRDLWGTPQRVVFNPFRYREAERPAEELLRELRAGNCREVFKSWMRDHRRDYIRNICDFEARHPLKKWRLVDRQDERAAVNLHYLGRRTAKHSPDGYQEHIFISTASGAHGEWYVTKYDAVY